MCVFWITPLSDDGLQTPNSSCGNPLYRAVFFVSIFKVVIFFGRKSLVKDFEEEEINVSKRSKSTNRRKKGQKKKRL